MLKGLFLPLLMGIAVVSFAKPKTEEANLPGMPVGDNAGQGVPAMPSMADEEKSKEQKMVTAWFLTDEQKKHRLKRKIVVKPIVRVWTNFVC